MVFVTAGMGGGTGTGAAPVVAEIARDMGALTVGIVTKPFALKASAVWIRQKRALQSCASTSIPLVVIPNERLKLVSEQRITLANAFSIADDVLRQGVQSISDLIQIPGIVNPTSRMSSPSCRMQATHTWASAAAGDKGAGSCCGYLQSAA